MNRQQLLKKRQKKKNLQQKQKMKKLDVIATYVYDLIVQHYVIPVLQEHFGFGKQRIERFYEKLASSELYSGLFRSQVSVNHKWIKQQRLNVDSYRMVWNYTIEQCREAVGYMGYGESRLSRMYDPHVKVMISWEELFNFGELQTARDSNVK